MTPPEQPAPARHATPGPSPRPAPADAAAATGPAPAGSRGSSPADGDAGFAATRHDSEREAVPAATGHSAVTDRMPARQPGFMGSYEVRIHLGGISRQRLFQIIGRPSFPKPVAELAQGKVWLTGDIEQWASVNRRKTAPPPQPTVRDQTARTADGGDDPG